MAQVIGMKLGHIHPDIQKAWSVDGWKNRHRWHVTRSSRARILRMARSGKYKVFMAKRYFVLFRIDAELTA
jgi:hypothetical protein